MTAIFAEPVAVSEPSDVVPTTPVSVTLAAPVTTTEFIPPVAAIPVSATFASQVTVSVPNAEVPATPVTATDTLIIAGSPQGPDPQVERPQPAIRYYAILIIAFDASAVGNVIVKLPAVDVLSPPKSNTATAGSPEAVSL